MNPVLKKLLDFSYSYAAIDRDLKYPNRERMENDAEHSYQLCLLAWAIIEMDKLSLDSSKVFKLCIAHDLVEVYSGDVPLWGKNGHDEKIEREAQALQIIKERFNETSEIASVISEYKERTTEEARFVYGLDKLLPLLNQLQTNGIIWKNHHVTKEQVLEKLYTYAKASEYLKKYFDEAIEYFKENSDTLLNA
jgi:putative hydrolase of HD superfamily